MAKTKRKRKRKAAPRKKQQEYPGWVWMLFGLGIGLSVALAIYMKDREPGSAAPPAEPGPASMASTMGDSGEAAAPALEQPSPSRNRMSARTWGHRPSSNRALTYCRPVRLSITATRIAAGHSWRYRA
jgi:hypothetical protein